MHIHIQNLEVCKKKIPWKILYWSLHPSEPTFNPPPPSLGFFISVFFFFFKILLRIKINSLALVYLKKYFLVELMLKINNLSDKICQPSPPSESNGRPLKHNYPFVLWCHFATVMRSRVRLFLGIIDVTISYIYHTTKTMYGSDLASLTDTVASLYTKEKVKHSVRKSIPNKVML